MLRTVVLLAGLGAALIIGGLPAVRSEAVPDSNQTAWVEQHVQDVTGGQSYRLDGCVTVTAPGLTSVSLRLEWYTEPDGFGTAFYNNNARADSQLVGPQQCLSLTATAPCPARSVRHGVLASPDPGAVEVSGLEFSMESGASPVPCATATPTPTPTPTTPAPEPEPTATPAPEPTAAPTPTPTPLSPAAEPAVSAATEPTLFPTLVNGGFEDLRQDGTPYGWRKVGGMTSTSSAVHTEGDRSAILISTTESTKWLYQTLEVEGGSYYRLRANALKSDPEAREALLRISWYESADGSGNQLSTSESPALTGQSLRFATLDTGPVQAPPEAQSAKVRLLLRPASAASTAVYFDDVRFGETAAPANEDPLNGERDPEVATEGGSSEVSGNAPQAAPAEAAALSAWAGPTPLANVRKAPEQQPDPATGGGRPLWPLLLALAVPAVGLTVMAGHAWWRARLAGGNGRHL